MFVKHKKKQSLRNNEYFDMQNVFDKLYQQSRKGKRFANLLDIITAENNILLAYRNIKSNKGSRTSGVDKRNISSINMNEPRFSNCFIEKRGSSYVESLVVRDFPLFVAPDLFFKILQMQKQYFYIGLKFRQYFSIKQACKHLQMPVVSYNSAFGEAALHYRTEYTPLRFCGNVVQRYSPSGRLPLS